MPIITADRRVDDEVIIVVVPAKRNSDDPNASISPDRPDDITDLRKESDNIYDSATDTFLCVMTVDKVNKQKMKDKIKAHPNAKVEEITMAKEAKTKEKFKDLDKAKEKVRKAIASVDQTLEEYKAAIGAAT